MNTITVSITVDVEIYDCALVIRAARQRARSDRIRLGRSLTAVEAVQYLVDPGVLPGCSVLQSTSDRGA